MDKQYHANNYNSKCEMSLTLLDAVLYAHEGLDPSKAIVNMEKRGQQSVCKNHRLPILCNERDVPKSVRDIGILKEMDISDKLKIWERNNKNHTRSKYESLGITVKSEYNSALYDVELPQGWSIVPAADHDMWNSLVDNSGQEVATFFYKACCGIMDEARVYFY